MQPTSDEDTVVVASRRIQKAGLPQWRRSGGGFVVGIERIETVVCGGYQQKIAETFAWDFDSRQVQRLRIDRAIHRQIVTFSEKSGLHVGRRQQSFIRIQAGARIVVVISDNARLRSEGAGAKNNGKNPNHQIEKYNAPLAAVDEIRIPVNRQIRDVSWPDTRIARPDSRCCNRVSASSLSSG